MKLQECVSKVKVSLIIEYYLGEVLMATHLVWDHEWQIRALPPRPNNTTVA